MLKMRWKSGHHFGYHQLTKSFTIRGIIASTLLGYHRVIELNTIQRIFFI